MRENLKEEFEHKSWAIGAGIPRSGSGSTLEATATLRAALPGLFDRFKVRTLLDAPCGDWHWMQTVDLGGIDYIGGDISSELVEAVGRQFGGRNRRFVNLDITSDPLPMADLMLCRDCLFHLEWDLRWRFFENFANSGIPFLMTSMHHNRVNEPLDRNGGFVRFNPCAAPFVLERPLEMIDDSDPRDAAPRPGDDATPGRRQRNRLRARWSRKSLAIWSNAQIAEALDRRETGASV